MAPSSSGLGRLAFIQEIAGSIPAGVTKSEIEEEDESDLLRIIIP